MLATYLQPENISALVGKSFLVSNGEVETIFQLKEVTPVRKTGKYENFSLFFEADKKYLLPQAVYAFSNEKVDSTELFTVPVGETENAYQYQVCLSFVSN